MTPDNGDVLRCMHDAGDEMSVIFAELATDYVQNLTVEGQICDSQLLRSVPHYTRRFRFFKPEAFKRLAGGKRSATTGTDRTRALIPEGL